MLHDFVVIEGNIGSGKTSLVKKLANEFGYDFVLEEFEENPFLQEFLKTQSHNNLAVELQFLIDRYHQLNKHVGNKVLSDYFIQKSLIFSSTNLNKYEKQLFDSYFQLLFEKTQKPDLLVYLNVETDRLLKNIKKRGREYEKTITPSYLEKVHCNYLEYFSSITDIPVLIIDTSTIDFVNDENHYEEIKKVINQNHAKGVQTLDTLVSA